MKKIAVPLGTLLLFLISQGCGNVRSLKITISNVNEVAKHVANSSLSDKDKQLFVGYLMRSTFQGLRSASQHRHTKAKQSDRLSKNSVSGSPPKRPKNRKRSRKQRTKRHNREALRHELSLSVVSLTPVSRGFMDEVTFGMRLQERDRERHSRIRRNYRVQGCARQ